MLLLSVGEARLSPFSGHRVCAESAETDDAASALTSDQIIRKKQKETAVRAAESLSVTS